MISLPVHILRLLPFVLLSYNICSLFHVFSCNTSFDAFSQKIKSSFDASSLVAHLTTTSVFLCYLFSVLLNCHVLMYAIFLSTFFASSSPFALLLSRSSHLLPQFHCHRRSRVVAAATRSRKSVVLKRWYVLLSFDLSILLRPQSLVSVPYLRSDG